MGLVIFLAIVAAIIVLIVMRKKRKKAEDLEELKNSKAYALAIKIADELKKQKGGNLGEVEWKYDSYTLGPQAFGCIDYNNYNIPDSSSSCRIYFSMYLRGVLTMQRNAILSNRFYGIENENIGILVYSYEKSQDMPDCIKIAAKVIEDSGFGQCKKIQ